MDTKTNTYLTDNIIVRGRSASERLAVDIIDEQKYRSKSVEMYKGDKQLRFVELRARGVSYQDAAEILHCSKSTLVNWNKELSMDIAEYKNAAKNDIVESYQVSQKYRLCHFADLYRRIKTELDKRNLHDIPTDKLYVMLEKCSNYIDDLSGEKRAEKQNMSVLSSTCVERVQTVVKCG